MSEPLPALDWSAPDPILRTILDRLPFGVLIYGPDRRAVWINRAFSEMSGLSQADLTPGTTSTEVSLMLHARGWYGTDDDAFARTMQAASLDASRPHRLTRITAQGRRLDVRYEPLPGGGYVVCTADVTALSDATAAADARARLLDTVLSASRAGIAVYGPDMRVVLRNDAYERLLGAAPGAIPPGTSLEAMLRAQLARGEYAHLGGEAYMLAQLHADRSRPRAVRRARPNGQVLDLATDPLPDGGFVLLANDVTALARAEEEARTRAALLESILAALPQGVSLFGPDRRARLVNPAYGAIMGQAAVRIGETMSDLIARRAATGEYGPGDAGQAYAAAATYDYAQPARRRRRRPDGTAIDVRTAPLPDGGHISVVADVTTEVEAEAEARRRAETLDLTLRHIRHGIMLFDREHRLVTFNPQAEALCGAARGWLKPGITRTELIAHLLERGVYGQGRKASQIVEQLHGAVLPRVERTLPDGSVVEQQADATPDGGYVLTLWDITWRRQSEAALREAKDAAEAASRAKSQFLATMSHELRTPLNAVIGFSETIAHEAQGRTSQDRQGNERIAEFAQAINDAGRHLLSLINDILDVARIEAGRVDLADQPVDLARLVISARRMMDPAARAAGISLATDVAENLPPVRADERRLRQVLLNLLSNAVKFTPSGGSASIIADRDAEGWLAIAVRDSGIGIAPSDLERVFDPFTQLDGSLARRFQGSGLGLFLSRALAAAHGGTLSLSSSPGLGTTALLRLPPERLTDAKAAPPRPDPQETAA
jgi:signal transduction histidine kinase